MSSNLEKKKTMIGEKSLENLEDREQYLQGTLGEWQRDYHLTTEECEEVRNNFLSDKSCSQQVWLDDLKKWEVNFQARHQDALAYNHEMSEFIQQFHRLDIDFEQKLEQKRVNLEEKYDLNVDHLTNPTPIVEEYRKLLDLYTKAVYDLAQKKQSLLFNKDDRAYLDRERQSLTEKVAQRIEQDLLEQQRQKYRDKLTSNLSKAIDPEFRRNLQIVHWLDESDAQDIDREMLAELLAVQPQPIVRPTPQPTTPPVLPGNGVIPNEPVVPPEPESSPKSPLWMFGAVGAGFFVFVGLAAIGLTHLHQLISQTLPPYQEIPESTLDRMPTLLHAFLSPKPLSGEISMKRNPPSLGRIQQETVQPRTITPPPVAPEYDPPPAAPEYDPPPAAPEYDPPPAAPEYDPPPAAPKYDPPPIIPQN